MHLREAVARGGGCIMTWVLALHRGTGQSAATRLTTRGICIYFTWSMQHGLCLLLRSSLLYSARHPPRRNPRSDLAEVVRRRQSRPQPHSNLCVWVQCRFWQAAEQYRTDLHLLHRNLVPDHPHSAQIPLGLAWDTYFFVSASSFAFRSSSEGVIRALVSAMARFCFRIRSSALFLAK
mmetsp:Transcript_4009/g.14184  ORF Transcript_4009/g.14184 Transcript_4009/m.14184 type:complete len:178 (-) Transcript_4009:131-664(-)